jgi:hypothetical protein
MNPHLRDFLHAVQVTLTFIGGGTVIGFIGWLFKRRQENFEDKVLMLFAGNPPARTIEGIHNDYRGQYLKDVPTWVVLPTHRNWRDGLKWRLRTIPYQVRHVWRMKFLMPSQRRVERTILSLWKRGLLIRDLNPKYYKLKQ